MEGLYEVFALSLATAAISTTTSRSKFFASTREWLAAKSEFLGGLAACGYCTSHWVAAGLVLVYRPVLIDLWLPVDLVVSIFAVIAVANIVSGMIVKLATVNIDDVKEPVSYDTPAPSPPRLVQPPEEEAPPTGNRPRGSNNNRGNR